MDRITLNSFSDEFEKIASYFYSLNPRVKRALIRTGIGVGAAGGAAGGAYGIYRHQTQPHMRHYRSEKRKLKSDIHGTKRDLIRKKFEHKGLRKSYRPARKAIRDQIISDHLMDLRKQSLRKKK